MIQDKLFKDSKVCTLNVSHIISVITAEMMTANAGLDCVLSHCGRSNIWQESILATGGLFWLMVWGDTLCYSAEGMAVRNGKQLITLSPESRSREGPGSGTGLYFALSCFFLRHLLFTCVLYYLLSVLVCLCMLVYSMQVPWRPQEGVRCPGAGVAGGDEPSEVHAGNWTLVLCRMSKCSCPLSHFSRPWG